MEQIKKIENVEENFNLNRSTDKNNKSILLKRARAKYFTLGLMFGLVELKSELKKSYWNTYYCASTIEHDGNKLKSKYCKNRWCLVCNRIRTAVNIVKYSDEVKSWGVDKYFVTLTAPTVLGEFLKNTIDERLNVFQKIMRVFENQKIKFIGIRKLECTYRPLTNKFHPHFHCIIKGKVEAELLLSEWLKRYPDADIRGQNVKQCDDNTVMELFKYFTKLISSGYDKNSDNSPGEYKRKIYINALDIVFLSIRGCRTFQSFGFKAKKVDESIGETIQVDEICDKIQYYYWEKELSDWINKETGEFLTGYKPSEAMKGLIDNISNSETISKQYGNDIEEITKQCCNNIVSIVQ